MQLPQSHAHSDRARKLADVGHGAGRYSAIECTHEPEGNSGDTAIPFEGELILSGVEAQRQWGSAPI
ncbi:MAG: hypothetical protein WCE82_07760 [Halobacteriota archaeon]